uniref:Kinase D-interacting substrate of 220 kDa-like isoform X1 n=1 Tax=Saccoglossus kowalevskii TaxID=10224 RepID=A0ABM0MJS0_SACKO|nr:PREDICTED: kinase D-interacting substrate of 220 kDa-like isoform X1 [Saccoglossus kowalevskii]
MLEFPLTRQICKHQLAFLCLMTPLISMDDLSVSEGLLLAMLCDGDIEQNPGPFKSKHKKSASAEELNSLSVSMSKVVEMLHTANENIAELNNKLDGQQIDFGQMQDIQKTIEAEVYQLKKENGELKKMVNGQSEVLDSLSRCNNVRIFGINEDDQEDEPKVASILSHHLGMVIGPKTIECVYRVGKPKDGYTRAVIVKFHSWKDKMFVLHNKLRFRDTQYFLVDDMNNKYGEHKKLPQARRNRPPSWAKDIHQTHDGSILVHNPYAPSGGGGGTGRGGPSGSLMSPRSSWYGGQYGANGNFSRGGWKRMSLPSPGTHLGAYNAGQPLIGNELLSPTSESGTDGMSIKDVCDRLLTLEGIDQHMIPKYQARVAENNINGHVLLQCDVDELKKVLGMTFGDWQLFRAMVIRIRNQERMRCGDFCDGSDIAMADIEGQEGGHLRVPGPDSFLTLSYEELRPISLLASNSPRSSPKLDESPTANPPDGPFSQSHDGVSENLHHNVNVQFDKLQCRTIPNHSKEEKKKHGKSVVLKNVSDENFELNTIVIHSNGSNSTNNSAKDLLAAKKEKDEDMTENTLAKTDQEPEPVRGRPHINKPKGKPSNMAYTMSYISDFSSAESLQNIQDRANGQDHLLDHQKDGQFLEELQKLKKKMSLSKESLSKKGEEADNEMSPLLTPVEKRKIPKGRPKLLRSLESLDFDTEDIPLIDDNDVEDSFREERAESEEGQLDENGIDNRRDTLADDVNGEELHIVEDEVPQQTASGDANTFLNVRPRVPSNGSNFSSVERKGKEVDHLFKFLDNEENNFGSSRQDGGNISEMLEVDRNGRERSSSMDATVGSNSERRSSISSIPLATSPDEAEDDESDAKGVESDSLSLQSKLEDVNEVSPSPSEPTATSTPVSQLEAQERRKRFNKPSQSIQGFPGEQEAVAEARRRPPLRRSASASSPYRHSDTSAMTYWGTQRPRLKTLEESFEEYISVTTATNKKVRDKERLTTNTKPFHLYNAPFRGSGYGSRARDNLKRRSAPPNMTQPLELSMHELYIEAKPPSPEDKEIETITSKITQTQKEGSPRQDTHC